MKKTILSFAILTALSTVAVAQEVPPVTVVSTGISGGVYAGTYGVNLARFLSAKKIPNKVVNSAGSMENLQRLEKDEAQITFATYDAYAYYLKKGGTQLNILAPLREECGYLVVKKNGKVRNEDDLQTVKGAVIAIGDSGSGSETMWNYMATLESGYKNAQPVIQGGTLAINQLGTNGGPDAFLFVTTQNNLTHKLVQAVNNKADLIFVDIDDNDLNDKLPNGSAVYTFKSNTVNNNLFGGSVTTICTTGAIFYNNSLNKNVLSEISDFVALSPTAITGAK